MYYFSLITSDYCEKAEMALISFFHYNDVTLHLYVVDDNYDKVCNYFKNKYYFNKLDIIKYYDKAFTEKTLRLKTINDINWISLTLNMYRILDDVHDNELIRIDLDVLYFGKIDFAKYNHALCGSHEEPLHFPKPWHMPIYLINIGIAKYTKDKFNLKDSFTNEMLERLKADSINYYIPDQDILNELTDDKFAISDCIISAGTGYACQTRIKAFHYTSLYLKPWVVQSKDNLIQMFSTNIKALGFLLYEKFAQRTNLFLKETQTNIENIRQYRPNAIYYTTVSNKKEFERLCGEINSWKI